MLKEKPKDSIIRSSVVATTKLQGNEEMIRSILEHPDLKDAYKLKLIDSYSFFSDAGYKFSYHALHQVVGRLSSNRIAGREAILEALRVGKLYRQDDGRLIRFDGEVAVIFEKTKEVVSVIPRSTVKEGWVLIDESNM